MDKETAKNRMSPRTDWWKDFFSGLWLDVQRQAKTEEETRAEADFIQKVLRLPPRARVLDVPCGDGRLSVELASRGYRVTGLDLLAGWVQVRPLEALHPAFRGQPGMTAAGLLLLGLLLQALLNTVGALVSEEAAFRGYLIPRWPAAGERQAVLGSAVLFGLWHLPAQLLWIHGGPLRTLLDVLNVALLGIVLGWLFVRSGGSLLPPSLFHGVWNSLEYTLYGLGNQQGVLVGPERAWFDPEEGLGGTALALLGAAYALQALPR